MRIITMTSMLLLFALSAAAQQQGKITYERTSKMRIQVSDPAFSNLIPPERKDRFELIFANNKTLWRAAEEAQEPEMEMDNGQGAVLRLVIPGSNDVTYSDLASKRKVEQREIFNRSFVVEDSIRALNWKISPDTKTILGRTCRKATAIRTQQSFRVNMENGHMKREQVTDTVSIVAWFTDAIPLFAGPEIYQGQLPGLILEMDINNGSTTYVATGMSDKADVSLIREPKGKKITPKEFAQEREKMLKELEANGGQFNIRVGGRP